MNQSGRNHNTVHRRRLSRAEVRRRRIKRAACRITGALVVVCVAVGGITFAVSHFSAGVSASAASASQTSQTTVSDDVIAENLENAAVSSSEELDEENSKMTAAQAQAMLDDPLMVLVNHTNKMPDDYTFDVKECGSKTATNKNLQTEACDAFLAMQAAAKADGITIWMQSGYRSVEYQSKLYTNKTNYYIGKGYDEATAKEKAAAVVNPPGYSEHNCGLAADLNCPEYTTLDEGFKNTKAYTWLCKNAEKYGFILRYPEGKEDETDIIYEPWHWRYVGVENAAKINASGMTFEAYIAMLKEIAQGA